MKEIYLDEVPFKEQLFPFALIRHVADIRVGILTIREKWEKLLGTAVSTFKSDGQQAVPANLLPSKTFFKSFNQRQNSSLIESDFESIRTINYPWDIFINNDWAIREDYKLLTSNRYTEPIPETVHVSCPSQIFIEAGAKVAHCNLNASTGPIYVGKNAEIMEGSLIRGPFALCEGSVVKMGSKIYGATTIGPFSIVGGEIKNSVVFGYSNKAHDGYLGDSVIGEWCNMGAGTSNSNLKNNAGEVRVWQQNSGLYQPAGQKCGVLLGDYSRCAINTSFNTGTVVGICSNVYGEGLTPKFIPSFTWGTKGLSVYEFQKAVSDIRNWKKLKARVLSEKEIELLKTIFDQP
ncbi:MAG TPA: putative sugar nucleotidyl transferase [Flavitalea sp.]|nr:putative sugar nucleotidyl transferase [Flavitalea sp.]